MLHALIPSAVAACVLCCAAVLSSPRHELKLGVLVNEVAALDVDGQLLSTSQSNAAAGIRAAQLAGGCACCSVSGDLQAALHDLAGSSSYQQLDYLVSVPLLTTETALSAVLPARPQ